MKPILAIVAISLLTACTPYAERVARTCERLGTERGTPQFMNCVQFEEANDTAMRQAYMGMSAAGFAMTRTQQPVVVVQPRY